MARRPFRRTLIFASVTLGTALAAAGGWKYARASAPLSGPIVIISIDTLRADHLPAYGYQKVKTPAIDQLASSGVVFERAYSHTPQTLPAHTALLAGRLPFETGVRDDVGARVKPGERLLPQLLRERGYSTAAVVSTSLLRKDTGISQGFDFFDDEMPPNPEDPSAEGGHRDGSKSEEIAEHWLDSAGTSRTFLFLHLNEPHKPYAPPERFSQYSPYDGEIAYADEIVGRLIHYLKTHQLYDQSTIVLLSDHGEGLGDHGEQEHGLFVYDEAIHVPLIIKQQSNVGAGRRVPDLVQHVDMVPTILDLVKAPAPHTLRGRSLKPLLDGTGRLRERPVYAEALYAHYHFGWAALTTVTDGRYQYIKAPREELFNLTRDPHERENLAGQNVETKQAAEALETFGSAAGKPVTTVADPKDKWEILERYRTAVDLVGQRKWGDAIALLQRVLGEEPEVTQFWNELAGVSWLATRYDVALDAYRHIIALEPSEPEGYLGAADVLLKERKLEDARARATEAADVSADKDTRSRAAAHALLARIALARRDPDAAREEAALAFKADPELPMPPFVEARILYDQGKYEDAWLEFEVALAAGRKPGATPIAELHFYAGDTLMRLNRHSDAEAEFADELRLFPRNVRARAGLATLYHASGQAAAADTAITDMLHAVPTPESYTTAARLLRSFGRPRRAEAIRAEARRTFASARR
ncbi:MAG: sulfatase-like hydrolase/transferase [Phycisphaerales bacterium]|nr:sulfatase-like hydrolase/transferase [Phycisphaerales bacterium]